MTPREHSFTRRRFLKTSALALGATALGPPSETRAAEPKPASGKMIGIQAGAISFVAEGPEKGLDIFQERGAINTIFLATFTYGRGIAGRQVQRHPFPDPG